MVRVSCALRKLIPGQSSREKRGGGSSCFRRQEKSSGLPDMQVIVIVFSGSLVIGQICQNMIFLFNDYNYQMKIIQMIFSSSESLATWTRWLLTSKHMCCNIRQVSEVSKERNDTSALNILNQQRFQ